MTTKPPEQQNSQPRNEGSISLILSSLDRLLRESIDRGHHGEIGLTIRLVGHDVTEFQLGTTTRTLTR